MQSVNASNDLPYSRKRKVVSTECKCRKEEEEEEEDDDEAEEATWQRRKTRRTSHDKAAMIARKRC
jgi:hypothetical protein